MGKAHFFRSERMTYPHSFDAQLGWNPAICLPSNPKKHENGEQA